MPNSCTRHKRKRICIEVLYFKRDQKSIEIKQIKLRERPFRSFEALVEEGVEHRHDRPS
jgi:hypothetical protein